MHEIIIVKWKHTSIKLDFRDKVQVIEVDASTETDTTILGGDHGEERTVLARVDLDLPSARESDQKF